VPQSDYRYHTPACGLCGADVVTPHEVCRLNCTQGNERGIMAGHSKWANIQHRKGAQDKKRGRLFTRLIREVTIAARMGGSDIASNPRLRLAVDKARAQSVPKDNIDRAVKRGGGELEGSDYQEIRYEGYGPGGTAVMVDCMTDNRNRTVADVRHAFSKFGGNLGADGSVSYLFNHVGLLSYPPGSNEDAIMAAAIDAGAEDVVVDDDKSVQVLTDPLEFETVRDAMREAGFPPDDAGLTMWAATATELGLEEASSMVKLLEALEDLDDVQNVYSNADIGDDVLSQL
jgi:YebC/PmpR family DNA-binding regulatory protein